MSEHTLYNKRQLCYTEVTDFTDIQGIGQDPLYKRFNSVYPVIEKNIAPQYRDFLAHPIYTDDDQIYWFVNEWKEMPTAYHNLPDFEKAKYSTIKEKTIAEYKQVQKLLSGEDKLILTSAIKYLDEDFMFCYDDKVVVVAWGMMPDPTKHIVKGSIIHDLKIQTNYKVCFNPGDHGKIDKIYSVVSKTHGSTLTSSELPVVFPEPGYTFKGWTPNPLDIKIDQHMTFTAVYDAVPEDVFVNVRFEPGIHGRLGGQLSYKIKKGSIISPSTIPHVVPETGYVFTNWDREFNIPIEEDTVFTAEYDVDRVVCTFVAGEEGTIDGVESYEVAYGTTLEGSYVPNIKPNKRYRFVGWNEDPTNHVFTEDVRFYAQYEKILPWYKRLWAWIKNAGCLQWLLWLLLAALLFWLTSFLLKSCDSDKKGIVDEIDTVLPVNQITTPDGRLIDDNRNPDVRDLDEYIRRDGRLPDNSVISPIVGEDGSRPPVISNPGQPEVISNRLNIFFDDAEVDLEQFINELKNIYSDDECTAIGFDPNIPMIQLRVKENMRDEIRESLNSQMPDYDFFVVDESIFTMSDTSTWRNEEPGWHIDAIHLEKGWEITKGSSDVIVAVIDDGIEASHEMFENRIVKPYNVFTQNNRLSRGVGHGTHVAGLAVGSEKNLSRGAAGVAPKCKLMPVQVFDNDMCTFSSLTCGILYAVHQGADVINVSVAPSLRGLDALSESEQRAIAETQFKNEEKVWKRIIKIANEHNCIIVFAVGNDNILASIPPENRTNQTVNVAAVNGMIDASEFTNYSFGTNISAPGTNIMSSFLDNSYQQQDGTSMAAPIVTGTIALMKSCKQEVTVNETLHILQATGRYVSQEVPPMVQVYEALTALTTGEIPIPDEKGPESNECQPRTTIPTPSTGDVQILLKWNDYNDLDLYCTDPSGEMISYQNKQSSSGGKLEIDMNVQYPDCNTPIENIFWPHGSAPSGTYNVYVKLYHRHENNNSPVPFEVEVKHNGIVDKYSKTATDDETIAVCSFEIPGRNSSNGDAPSNRGDDNLSNLEMERERLKSQLDRIDQEIERIKNGRLRW